MSIVKISNKDQLDRLMAMLTLRLGRKPTQQEVVGLCLKLGEKGLEMLITELFPIPILDENNISKILAISEKLKDVPWDEISEVDFISDEDRDIYSV